MKVKEEGMSIYLDQTWSDFVGRFSQNQLLKFWIQKHYGGWIFKMVWKFLFFHYFIEKFLNFYPLSIVFDPFWLFWTVWTYLML